MHTVCFHATPLNVSWFDSCWLWGGDKADDDRVEVKVLVLVQQAG